MADPIQTDPSLDQKIEDQVEGTTTGTTKTDESSRTQRETSDKVASDAGGQDNRTAEGGTAGAQAKLYADIFETPEDLETGLFSLADKLGVQKFTLRPYLKTAKESQNYDEIAEIYKDLQSQYTRQQIEAKTAESVNREVETRRTESEAPRALNDQEKRNFVMADVEESLKDDPIRYEFMQRNVEFPSAKIGTPEWDRAMLDLADQSPGLFSLLKDRIATIGRDAYQYLQSVETAISEASDSKRVAISEGQKFLTNFNTSLGIGLTPDDIAEITAKAVADPRSSSEKHKMRVVNKDAVEEYFYRAVLSKRFKDFVEKAVNKGKLEVNDVKTKMREAALSTVSTTSLSQKADRRGADEPKFKTHEAAMAEGEKAINERIAKLVNE